MKKAGLEGSQTWKQTQAVTQGQDEGAAREALPWCQPCLCSRDLESQCLLRFCVQAPCLPSPWPWLCQCYCVALGSLFTLAGLQFPYLYKGDNEDCCEI